MSDVAGRAAPRVVAVGGLVAAGKSSVARALSERLGSARIEADRIRDELLRGSDDEPVHETDWWHAFESGFEDEIYDELFRRAEERLARGESVVLDGCFSRSRQRLAARTLALTHGLDFLFVECRVPLGVTRARLAARDAVATRPGWQAVWDDLAARWEPESELLPFEHLAATTDGELDDTLTLIEQRLGTATRTSASRLVTFDCWNTLLFEPDWEAAHEIRVAELRDAAHEAGHAVSREDAATVFDKAWSRHMELWGKGVATGAREVARWSLTELGLENLHPALEHLVLSFEEASHSSGVCALQGARETLHALQRSGVPCALICDTGLTPGRVVRRHLAREGLLDALAVQVFSDEVGVPKPDARAFDAALRPLGAAPESGIHVGDLRRTDVAGARAFGMTSIRIRERYDDTDPLPDADHVVGSHAALRALLTDLGFLG
ncbi:MAG: AAA family ATPase [Deltaproteobacteria bacterium]|nr:AAA family ATPase [Deltaproteobacteria bacterium]